MNKQTIALIIVLSFLQIQPSFQDKKFAENLDFSEAVERRVGRLPHPVSQGHAYTPTVSLIKSKESAVSCGGKRVFKGVGDSFLMAQCLGQYKRK